MARRMRMIIGLGFFSFLFSGQSLAQKATGSSVTAPNLKLGVQALFAGDYAKAETIARQQLKVAPRSSDALVLLARVQMAQGKYPLAFGSLRKALDNSPSHIEALYFMGKLSGALSQMEYQQLAGLAPNSPRIHQLMGDSYQAAGENEKAEAEYRAALSLQPDLVEVGLDLGDMLRTQRKYEDSLKAYSQILDNKPGDFWSLFGSGMCYQGLQQFSQAANFFQKACEVVPNSALSRLALGNVLLKLGEPDKAAGSLKLAASLDPSLREAYSLLGRALQISGQPEQAAKAFEEAQKLLQLELDQRRVKFRKAFGMENAEMGTDTKPVSK
jgi:tetratricopeptide (TPR) repeat protein